MSFTILKKYHCYTEHMCWLLALQVDDNLVYPSDTLHEQNFAYVIVDPLKRLVSVLSHQFGASYFA